MRTHDEQDAADFGMARELPTMRGEATKGPLDVVPLARGAIVNNNHACMIARFYCPLDVPEPQDQVEAIANAHLFKAAPMMLATLEAVWKIWTEGTKGTTPFPDIEVRAAIKAAKGE